MEIKNIIASFWEQHNQIILLFLKRIIAAALIILGGKIIIDVSKRLTRTKVLGKMKTDETVAPVMQKVVKYSVLIICAIIILDDFGINTTSLIALLGAAGVAVGFALRDTLSNIAAGIIILVLRPFNKNDFIECTSVAGTVREIGLFTTNMETSNGIFVSVPNSALWGKSIMNYSHNPRRLMEIKFTISYSDSVDTVFQVLQEIIDQEPQFEKDPPPQYMVQSLGELGVVISFIAWAAKDIYWNLYWDKLKTIKEKMQEAGIMFAVYQKSI